MASVLPPYSATFVEWARTRSMSKRARECLEHLLRYGTLSTEQLNQMGYEHPPRAIRDLRDAGVVVETGATRNHVGKRIAEYTLVPERRAGRAGRKGIPKTFRESVNHSHEYRCALCSGEFASRELQCDHRIPFEIGGDPEGLIAAEWMPLCASCNRSKSWSCEHCPNWKQRDPDTCGSCFWAFPQSYSHVATTAERRLSVIFRRDEVEVADLVARHARQSGLSTQELVKRVLADKFGLPEHPKTT